MKVEFSNWDEGNAVTSEVKDDITIFRMPSRPEIRIGNMAQLDVGLLEETLRILASLTNEGMLQWMIGQGQNFRNLGITPDAKNTRALCNMIAKNVPGVAELNTDIAIRLVGVMSRMSMPAMVASFREDRQVIEKHLNKVVFHLARVLKILLEFSPSEDVVIQALEDMARPYIKPDQGKGLEQARRESLQAIRKIFGELNDKCPVVGEIARISDMLVRENL